MRIIVILLVVLVVATGCSQATSSDPSQAVKGSDGSADVGLDVGEFDDLVKELDDSELDGLEDDLDNIDW